MEKIQLPNYPTSLPDHMDVRDFALEGGKYARIIMELETEPRLGHFHLKAQAYEMNSDGTFAVALNGYPSRTKQTEHTVPEQALGDTIQLDDAWVRDTGAVDPMALNLVRVTGKPATPGETYGQLVWDDQAQHAWKWTEGFADVTARGKVQELLSVLSSTTVRSGIGFRR